MRKSGRVRFSDLRQAYRLIHECRDVGHDPEAWPKHLVGGLTRLVDGQVCVANEIGVERPGLPRRLVHWADCGWLSPDHGQNWKKQYTVGQEFRKMATFQRFAAFQTSLTTKSREQLVGDADWYKSDEFNVFHRSMGIDDIMASFARTEDPPGFLGFAIFRALGREPFRAWERRLIHLFHREFGRYLDTALVREPGGLSRRLPPRLRETLRCLLEGDSEKQAALRLGLSRHTVHQYAKDLHRLMGVNSRAELMAMCLRHDVRGGPDRFC